jgi:8-oxo-dGTP diphosphatase
MVIRAAGAVLWREVEGSVAVAVVHRPRYDDWSLPKGKLDKGETAAAAAVREVAEETGWSAVLGGFVAQVDYAVPQGAKRVDYFAARAVAGAFAVNDEVDELLWLPPAQARALLTYEHDRVVLDRFPVLRGATTALLVRHAHAGKKELWSGPDDERPLSPTGRRQRGALNRLLPLFRPDRVHAVPKERCVATVAPLAGRLGLAVVPEPELSEQRHREDPRAAAARVRELVAAGGVPVLCGQGGVIPDLLADLAEGTGVPVDSRCRKGSLWLLSFADGKLVSAHYTAP